MKKKTRSILLVVLVSLLAITGFLTQCVHYTIEDYWEYAFSEARSFLYDDLLIDEEIDRFTLYDIEEDSIGYRFRWCQMSDTNDSITISTTIEKRWPYWGGGGCPPLLVMICFGCIVKKLRSANGFARSLISLILR